MRREQYRAGGPAARGGALLTVGAADNVIRLLPPIITETGWTPPSRSLAGVAVLKTAA